MVCVLWRCVRTSPRGVQEDLRSRERRVSSLALQLRVALFAVPRLGVPMCVSPGAGV